MSAQVLMNLLNELGKRDKMRGLPSIFSLFRNQFNKFNNLSTSEYKPGLIIQPICHTSLALIYQPLNTSLA